MDKNFLISNKEKLLLSIIVPVYFNEKSLNLLYQEICKLEKAFGERVRDRAYFY